MKEVLPVYTPVPQYSTFVKLLVCVLYASVSTFLLMTNKTILTYYSFPSKFFFLLAQQIITIISCTILKVSKHLPRPATEAINVFFYHGARLWQNIPSCQRRVNLPDFKLEVWKE